MRICKKCKKEKDNSEFNKSANMKDKLHPWCKDCARNIAKEHYYNNKDRYIANTRKYQDKLIKLICDIKDFPCLDCMQSYPHYIMEFDHVRGEKFLGVSRMMSRNYSLEKILEEIKKCDLVCANCHRERTNKRNPSRHTRNRNVN